MKKKLFIAIFTLFCCQSLNVYAEDSSNKEAKLNNTSDSLKNSANELIECVNNKSDCKSEYQKLKELYKSYEIAQMNFELCSNTSSSDNSSFNSILTGVSHLPLIKATLLDFYAGSNLEIVEIKKEFGDSNSVRNMMIKSGYENLLMRDSSEKPLYMDNKTRAYMIYLIRTYPSQVLKQIKWAG